MVAIGATFGRFGAFDKTLAKSLAISDMESSTIRRGTAPLPAATCC
jgi:hypothetical protein